MKCRAAKKLIPRYLDSELDARRAGDLQAHLLVCRECSAEAEALSKTLGLLDAWTSPEPTLGFEAFRERTQVQGRAESRFRTSFPVPGWAAAMLAVLSIGVGAMLGAMPPEPAAQKKPSQTQVASAIGLHSYDDLMEASLARGASPESGGKGAAR